MPPQIVSCYALASRRAEAESVGIPADLIEDVLRRVAARIIQQ